MSVAWDSWVRPRRRCLRLADLLKSFGRLKRSDSSTRRHPSPGNPAIGAAEQMLRQKLPAPVDRHRFDGAAMTATTGRARQHANPRRRPQLAQPRDRDGEHRQVADVLAGVAARVDQNRGAAAGTPLLARSRGPRAPRRAPGSLASASLAFGGHARD